MAYGRLQKEAQKAKEKAIPRKGARDGSVEEDAGGGGIKSSIILRGQF